MIQSLPFRGFHYDIARGAYLRRACFHDALRHAAKCGYTHFLPYLEHMIRLPPMERACPEVAYTPQDWIAFEQTATEAGIELVPHFNVIGHTEHICAAYPELAGPTGGRELDVDRKATREWMLSCLESFCSFSSSQYFLIGGDEWQAPDHLLKHGAHRIGKLWVEHVNEAIAFLAQRGRTALVWHDMLLHYPQALEHLSKNAVVVFWFYDANEDYPVLETFRRYGFRTIVAAGCNGHLHSQRLAGVDCAIKAVQRHQTDGFLMTSWGGRVHWEAQKVTMEEVAKRWTGKGDFPEASALSACMSWWRGIGEAEDALKELGKWTRFPDYQAYLRAELTGDTETQRCLYEVHQYPCGPIHDAIAHRRKPELARRETPAPIVEEDYTLEVSEDARTGTVLRFLNGKESFAIYPRYGATLQDWRLGEDQLIAHTLPSFLKTHSGVAGGYRSFTRALGFRPIWALGIHHNPNILWQHPFEWKRLEGANPGVELTLSLEHCEVRYRVSVEKGSSGFHFEAQAIPTLGGLYGAWNFNLPLVLEDRKRSRLSLNASENHQGGGWRPGVETVEVTTPHWQLEIIPEAGQTTGCFVDCGPNWITPDLHGYYRIREKGEIVTARWQFSVAKGTGNAS